ncbi:MAG: GHMP kinase [Acidimicrobiia bacterium]|nr:GHMP kinase [Acidimicrobiia bacterium]
MTEEIARVIATAPVRVADVGGWTDTWFGSPGSVCNLAVGPGVTVEANLVAGPDGADELPVRVVAPTLGEDYRIGPSPAQGWRWSTPRRQPLLEHAIASVLEEVSVPAGLSVDLEISSAVPAGASLGTSGSVVVAVLGALDALFGRARPLADLAVAAHAVETVRAGRESGVADQWAAAHGGCALLSVERYPEVRRQAVVLDPVVERAVGERLVTVVFGSHDSSAVHAEVIEMMGGAAPVRDRARAGLGQLAALAGDAAAALRGGSVDTWAEVLTAASDAQRALYPDLVGPAHCAAIEVARAHGATGWKVNGAGGRGGSLSMVAADRDSAGRLGAALGLVDRSWHVVDLTPAPGLDVVTVRSW